MTIINLVGTLVLNQAGLIPVPITNIDDTKRMSDLSQKIRDALVAAQHPVKSSSTINILLNGELITLQNNNNIISTKLKNNDKITFVIEVRPLGHYQSKDIFGLSLLWKNELINAHGSKFTDLNSNTVDILARILQTAENIPKILDLSDNPLEDREIEVLLNTLFRNPTSGSITHLILKNTGIGNGSMKSLSDFVARPNCRLLVLLLDQNRGLDDIALMTLCEGLKYNDSIENLGITDCNISNGGLNILFELSKYNNTLEYVNINYPLMELIERDFTANRKKSTISAPYIPFLKNLNSELERRVQELENTNQEVRRTVSQLLNQVGELKEEILIANKKLFEFKLMRYDKFTKKQQIQNSVIISTLGESALGILNNIQFKQSVASGSDGIVCIGRLQLDNNKSIDVAIKIFPNMGIETRDLGSMFRNEFSILQELNLKTQFHRNIIQLYKYFEAIPPDEYFNLFSPTLQKISKHPNGTRRMTSFLIMEYHPKDLLQFVSQEFQNLKTFDKLVICFEIGNALNFLYQNHIAHRDLKLNNFLVSSNLQVILCDFGYAIKLYPETHEILLEKYQSIGGNPQHLAPELGPLAIQLNQSNTIVTYKKQSSWEFALLCFEVLFGEFPDEFFAQGTDKGNFFTIDFFHRKISEFCLFHEINNSNNNADNQNIGRSNPVTELAQWFNQSLQIDPIQRIDFPRMFQLLIEFIDRYFGYRISDV